MGNSQNPPLRVRLEQNTESHEQEEQARRRDRDHPLILVLPRNSTASESCSESADDSEKNERLPTNDINNKSDAIEMTATRTIHHESADNGAVMAMAMTLTEMADQDPLSNSDEMNASNDVTKIVTDDDKSDDIDNERQSLTPTPGDDTNKPPFGEQENTGNKILQRVLVVEHVIDEDDIELGGGGEHHKEKKKQMRDLKTAAYLSSKEEQDIMQQFQPLGGARAHHVDANSNSNTPHFASNQEHPPPPPHHLQDKSNYNSTASHTHQEVQPPLLVEDGHTINLQRLLQALSDAVNHSDGIIAAEVWTLNKKRSHLVRAKGGYYRHPNYQPYNNSISASRALSRLEDESSDDYMEAKPTQPGVGIAGQLWSGVPDVRASTCTASSSALVRGDGHANGNAGGGGIGGTSRVRRDSISAFGSYHGGMTSALSNDEPKQNKRYNLDISNHSLHSLHSIRKGLSFLKNSASSAAHHARNSSVLWKELIFLAQDPDQIPDDRLDCFLQAGMGLAAGMKYNLQGDHHHSHGLVIYYAREGTPMDTLEAAHNTHFLFCATDYIGAALAMSESRATSLHWNQKVSSNNYEMDGIKSSSAGMNLRPSAATSTRTGREQQSMLHNNHWPRIDVSLHEMSICGLSVDIEHEQTLDDHSIGMMSDAYALNHVDDHGECGKSVMSMGCDNGSGLYSYQRSYGWRRVVHSMRSFITIKSNMFYEKTFGKKTARPPPAMPFSETMWVLIGSSMALVLASFLSFSIPWFKPNEDSGGDGGEILYAFPLGPLGALATLQFSLTAAPASQPRNAIYGTAMAGAVGICFSYIPTTILPHWLRLALGTSCAITMMTKWGVTHPPGGALATLYCSGVYHWGHLVLSLMGCWVCILLSVMVNNLNERRQYPMYWNFQLYKKERK